ncbi:MAG: hypothetical protein RLZZ230_27 [Candidatus Parcubacteria bacterium]|jgi:uncharacterized protein YfaS (alpha-2-macroglobulin family)
MEQNIITEGQTVGATDVIETKEIIVEDPANKELNDVPSMKKKPWWLLLGLVILLVIVLIIKAGFDDNQPIKQFTNIYSFVPEKISKSANIVINLPAGIDKVVAQSGITFSPEIKGDWLTENQDGIIVFDPNKSLETGVYYAINLNTEGAQMSGDFYVDDDPKVMTIFPAAGSETNEDSEITIVFNRPMVPLSTLATQESVALPITITPPTEGKFKWISTRNLQFIPTDTLIPASDYVVTIKEGMFSVDGLPVDSLTHTFITRPLRYKNISEGTVGYRDPVVFEFNQPVDLAETKKYISVKKDGNNVPVVVEYGEDRHYDYEKKEMVSVPDESKLFVYLKEDSHGRSRLWDFESGYEVSITEAVPLKGTKHLLAGKHTNIHIPNIIAGITAKSDRSDGVRQNVFDPKGTLVITFHDDIDKDGSDFKVKGLRSVEYAERCKLDNEGQEIKLGNSCEKEANTKQLIFSFNEAAFNRGEEFTLELKKIKTKDGFKANTEVMPVPLKTYSEFNISRTVPNSQTTDAALDVINVCSNTPLQEPSEEVGLSSYIKTSEYIVYGRWNGSWYIDSVSGNNVCQVGEYQTRVLYGLLPLTKYDMNLNLVDEFGQTATQQLSFTTQGPSEKYTRFHNMQQLYNVTTPERTNFTYAAENLDYVDMSICRLEPETFLKKITHTQSESSAPDNSDCAQVINERIELPPRYWVNNYFQIDLHKYFPDTRGYYIVTFSNPLYVDHYRENESRPIYDRTYISVTNLAVGKKEVKNNDRTWSSSDNPAHLKLMNELLLSARNLYWVNDTRTLTAVSNATVTQYLEDDKERIFTKTLGVTDAVGIARVATDKNVIGAVVRYGSETAVISNWSDVLEDVGPVYDASRTYIYTDRPIYRPGQTVYIRGIDRIGFDGQYEIWNKDQAKLEVYDSLSDWKGSLIYETNLDISDYGTFNSQFEIPKDAKLGTYSINVFGQNVNFSVEEYVPAAFKVETSLNKEEYISGDDLQLTLQADYYFGVPLDGGTIAYSVTAQDYHFDRYTDEYFNFGQSWYYCYYCGYGDDFLFRGEAVINKNGQAVIERKLDLDKFFTKDEDKGSKLVVVSMTAKDTNGRSVSAQRSFIVHQGEFYLGVKTDSYYTGVNSPITLRVKSVDTQGEPVSLKQIERALYKVRYETYKRQEVDGGFYYRSEKHLDLVSKENITTDEKGDWSNSLSISEEGQYEIQISKTDNRGDVIKTTTNLYIYGNKAVQVPPNNNYELDIEVEQSSLKVGDTATLLIKSPYENAKALISVERGTVQDYWVVDIKGGLYVHKFQVKSDYAPNFNASVLLLSPNPEIKYGSVQYQVGYDEHELSVEVTSDKTFYLPGEEVTLSVSTKDNLGRPVPAEVSLAVADLSVLALKGNPKKNPALFFYDGFPLSVSTASNIKNILYEVDIPLGTKGGGGGSPDDLAKKKRGNFKDTAFWEASVRTDDSGQASVTFTLPDNLTTWQIESLGVTKDTKLGVDYAEFTSKKDLMAVPLKPRFVVAGDKFSLGAKVFNQTDKGVTINVKLESDTLVFDDEHESSIFVNQGESKTVYFPVTAPAEKRFGQHTFTFTAEAEDFVDSVDQVIPITPNKTYETVATANFTKEDKATEYVYLPKEVVGGEGGLTINANATLAVFMNDAVSYMVSYPYGCSEQLASSLSTIAIMKQALAIPNVDGELKTIDFEGVTHTVDDVVKDGLDRIYQTQTTNGGFAYYGGLRPSLSLTMHVATALTKLKTAGFSVREDVLQRAAKYIETESNNNYQRSPGTSQEIIIMAEYTLRSINGNKETGLTNLTKSFISDKAFLNEKISSMGLAYLALLSPTYGKSNNDLVYNTLKNRINIDGRGAYLKHSNMINGEYYETSIKDTALLLKVFAVQQDEHPAMGNVLRWLLASRDKYGVWGGTHNTFTVIDAMVEYLNWQHETEANFTLKGIFDGTEAFTHEFNQTNIFETFTHFISIDSMKREQLLKLALEKENHGGVSTNLYYDMTLKYYLPVENLPPRDEGITITRALYKLDDKAEKKEILSAKVGEVIRGKLTLTIPAQYTNVSIEDMIPAGFEIVNFSLATEDQTLLGEDRNYSPYYEQSKWWYEEPSAALRTLNPTHVESHDDRIFLYIDQLTPGVYKYEYYLRALVPGEFRHMPARAEELFFPEVFGRTSGDIVKVTE